MGRSRSVAEFSRKLGLAGDAVRNQAPPAIRRGATVAKREIELERNRAVGSDGKFSRSGIRFGVGYNVGTTTDTPQALVFARGPWGMIESGTRSHTMTSRYGGGSRRSRTARAETIGPVFVGRGRNRRVAGRTGGDRRAVLNIPGIGYRRSARHPGTRGKRAWTRGRERAFRATPRIMADPITEAVRGVFR